MPSGSGIISKPTFEFYEKFQYYHKQAARQPGIYLTYGTSEKSAVSSVSLEYLKRLILPTNVIIADPGGMVVPYEGGYALLALMQKDWTNEKTLVAAILDKMVTLQNADGSWYQQYYPYKNFSYYENRKVDSGAALQAWAMADYDARNASITYKTAFRKAADFLYSLRWELGSYYDDGTLRYRCLLKNQVINGVKEDVAFAADVAEAILALIRGLQAYGDPLTTDPGGYDVKTFCRKLVEGVSYYMWRSGDFYYQTEYPLGAESESCKWPDPNGTPVKITFRQCVTFVQALVTWANKQWDNTYGAGLAWPAGSHEANDKDALDRVITLNRGRFGGYIEHMQYTAHDPPQQYAHYTALMKIALEKVDSTRYSRWINEAVTFLRKSALSDGQVLDQVFPDGRAIPSPHARGPLMVTAATAILAGA